jgi:hypothetical protein
MKVEAFHLNLDVSGEDIGLAAWAALKASAWVLYTSQLMVMWVSKEFDIKAMSDDEKIKIARRAFEYVADNLPPESQFRSELMRFAEESLTAADLPLFPLLGPSPAW